MRIGWRRELLAEVGAGVTHRRMPKRQRTETESDKGAQALMEEHGRGLLCISVAETSLGATMEVMAGPSAAGYLRRRWGMGRAVLMWGWGLRRAGDGGDSHGPDVPGGEQGGLQEDLRQARPDPQPRTHYRAYPRAWVAARCR